MEQEWITKSQTCCAHIEIEYIILKLMCPNDHRLLRFLSSVYERQTNHRLQHSHHRILTVKRPLHLPSIPWQPNLYRRHVHQLLIYSHGRAFLEAVFKWRKSRDLRHSYFLWKKKTIPNMLYTNIWNQTLISYTKKIYLFVQYCDMKSHSYIPIFLFPIALSAFLSIVIVIYYWIIVTGLSCKLFWSKPENKISKCFCLNNIQIPKKVF